MKKKPMINQSKCTHTNTNLYSFELKWCLSMFVVYLRIPDDQLMIDFAHKLF